MVRTVDYRELKGDYVLVDVRSPQEFKESTIEGAVNIPIFTDEERKIIGTIYTRESVEKAKRLGVEIASKRLLSMYDEMKELEKKHGKLVLFCARGGMRSGVIAEILAALGMKIDRIKDGYKGYRKVINEDLPELNKEVKLIVLHGNTGVGKTEILKVLENRGLDVLDLEGLANHRGSLLGGVGLGEQTTQKHFESGIYHKLKRRKTNYVFIEAESRRIGKVLIPEYIHENMKNGLHIFVDADLEFRSNLIINEYVKDENCNAEIIEALQKFNKYISEKNIERYTEMVSKGEYAEVVSELMVKYYDPMYMHSSNKYNYDLKVFIKDFESAATQIEEWFKTENRT